MDHFLKLILRSKKRVISLKIRLDLSEILLNNLQKLIYYSELNFSFNNRLTTSLATSGFA